MSIPTMKIIVGSSNERIDDPSFGHIRYNTDINEVEIYGKDTSNNTDEWRSLIVNTPKYEVIKKSFITKQKQGDVSFLEISGTTINSHDDNLTFSINGVVKISISGGTMDGTSDDRLKHNEEIIPNSLDLIDKLKPYKYQKTNKMYDASYNGIVDDKWVWEIGLIAQDILAIPYLNFMVNQIPDNGIYTLSYLNFLGLLVQGTKDLYNENKSLKNDIISCKKDTHDVSGSFLAIIDELNNKVKALESRIISLEN